MRSNKWIGAAGVACLLAASLAGRSARAGAVGDVITVGPAQGQPYLNPRVAMNPATGDFVVLWHDDQPESHIYFQVYDDRGQPRTDVKSIAVTRVAGSDPIKLAMNRQGRFVVTWPASDGAIHYQFFDPAGNPLGEAKAFGLSNYYPFDLAMNASGEALIAWLNDGRTIDGLRLNPDGEARGDVFSILTAADHDPTESPWSVRAAINEAGEFVVAWDVYKELRMGDKSFFPGNLYARRYDALGQPRGAAFALTHDVETSQYVYKLLLDAEGGFTVLSNRQQLGLGALNEDPGLFAQVRSSSGEVVRDTFRVDHGAYYYTPPVYSDGHGRAVLVWTNGTDLQGRWLDSMWTPLKPEFSFPSSTNVNVISDVAGDGNGNLVVAWTSWKTGDGYVPFLSVNRYAFGTETRVEVSPSPARSGDYLTFTAHVSAPPGAETPTGSVAFSDGDKPLGRIPLDADGRAEYVTRSLLPGPHRIRAEYVSADAYFGSTGEVEGGVTVFGEGGGMAGDVDGDGLVGVGDAVALLRSLVTGEALPPAASAAGDVNGDGTLDISDGVGILRLSVGLTLAP